MQKEQTQKNNLTWLEDNTVLLVEAGSLAYGTNLPTSDRDLKGICIPPLEYYFGLQNFEQYQPSGDNSKRNTAEDEDKTIYSLKKFSQLALNGNPNVLEMLFTDKESVLQCTHAGEALIKHRNLFLSNRITKSFGGFALQQRKRLERGLQQREELVEQFGYDTKTLMHAVRLYEMGIECFLTGTMLTRRPNADELKAIRNGRYTYEEALELLDIREKEFQFARENSVLPDKPNFKAVENLLVELTVEALKNERES